MEDNKYLEISWLNGYDLEKLNVLYEKYDNIKEQSEEEFRDYFEHSKEEYENYEILKEHKHLIKELCVSNFGNIKYNGSIIPSTWVKNGPNKGISNGDYDYYKEILFPNIPIKRYIFKTYRLIAEAWHENPNPSIYSTVHHIGNDFFDNKSNLLFTTSKQHFSIYHCWSDKRKKEYEKLKFI